MHRLAHLVIPSETEGEVAHAAAGLRLRQVFFDPCYRLDEVHTIRLMLLQSCTYRQDVHVDDDILWRESDACQQSVGPFRDSDFPFVSRCLSLLVEGHHHHGGSQSSQLLCLLEETFLTVLQTDGVDDTFALHVLQSCEDGVPVR